MTSSDKTDQTDETQMLIDAQSLSTQAKREPNLNQQPELGMQQESISSSEQELKALLERDSRKPDAKFGNAIANQQTKAKHEDYKSSHASSGISTEYEYHADRILFVVVISLVVASFIGWAAYLFLSEPSSDVPFAEGYQALSQGEEALGLPSIPEATVAQPSATPKMNTPPTENTAIEDSMNALEAVVLPPAQDVASTSASTPVVSSSKPVANNIKAELDELQSTSSEMIAEAQTPDAILPSDQPQMIAALEKPEFQLPKPPESKLTASKPTASTAALGPSVIQSPQFISRAHLARGVQQLEPIGIYQNDVISLEGRGSFRLFWFTHITELAGQNVSHVWYYQGTQVAQVNMTIGSSSWRASSNKRVATDTLGQWRVDAVTAEGEILASQSFQVVE